MHTGWRKKSRNNFVLFLCLKYVTNAGSKLLRKFTKKKNFGLFCYLIFNSHTLRNVLILKCPKNTYPIYGWVKNYFIHKKWKHFESPDDNIVEDDCRRPEHEVTAEDGLSKLENEDIIEVEWRRLDITDAVSPELVALYFVFIEIGNLKNLFEACG